LGEAPSLSGAAPPHEALRDRPGGGTWDTAHETLRPRAPTGGAAFDEEGVVDEEADDVGSMALANEDILGTIDGTTGSIDGSPQKIGDSTTTTMNDDDDEAKTTNDERRQRRTTTNDDEAKTRDS